ncbi:hypothetical protein NMG60_11000833 [Bertholletia excelsa]
MNHSQAFLVVLFLLFHFNAQNSFALQGWGTPNPSFSIIMCVLIVMLCLVLLVLAYAKFCLYSPPDLPIPPQSLRQLIQSSSRFSGIDQEVIESLPFFTFSSLKGSKEGLECVVCLSTFEQSEVLRLLPKCGHAFHMSCIDKWLQSHSSCPLCRQKFDAWELTSYSHTNSMRYTGNSSNLIPDVHVELIVEREQDGQSQNSSRFELGKPKKENMLVQQDEIQRVFHKFKHKIVVSDIVHKSRWSDLNSSDLMFLNSEMTGFMSSKRFSLSSSSRSQLGFSINDQLEKVKEVLERKRVFESGVCKKPSTISSLLTPEEKRSMSEIANLPRIRELSLHYGNNGGDERKRRIWMPIAARTVEWFASQGRRSEESESKTQLSNV